ncbi:GNAT family N-acetyltransferase [Sabulilitoribacter multivorans]|uniref:GNAT family N-acetyltransferase n=1 Tax=Flaviramulus multivorans TaxID=1304750 RepID=A0ABS9IJP3_9FLAO|nr:GNAT family N-acetyltransferase [Flaviramulus multivorans]MCF7560808.1 GNAT family N-acetyltransferase [Flaviramulus multivorans]
MKKTVSDFFFEHYEKSNVPEIYHEILYTQGNKVYTNPCYNLNKCKTKVNSVMFVPAYIQPSLDGTVFKLKKISQFFKGYAIELDEFKTIDEYLKFRFKKNSKSILKKVKRLEHCFSVSYHFYFGEISQKDYDFYMDELKLMIIKRFKQRGDVSQNLLNWEHYYKIFFDLINSKKASLFVIKNNNEPICISISNHFNGKMFSSVSSYNIDYGKFSLGNIEIYKKLEWCINNNHNTYEMGMGDLSYKREWSNNVYNFEHHIVYPKKSIQLKVIACLEYLKIYFKELIYKLAYVRYKNFKSKLKKTEDYSDSYTILDSKNIDAKDYIKINYNKPENQFLKNAIFDFLYSKIEHEKDVSVFEKPKQAKVYLITGKSNSQIVQF